MKQRYLYLDTETFSEVDLKKCGSFRYAEDESTEILLAPYAIDDGPVKCWDCTTGDDMPDDLWDALTDERIEVVGQNFLMFDRPVILKEWGYDIPVRRIVDTMVVALRHSLPGSLDALCKVFGLSEDKAKDKRGKALIKRFSKPTPKNYKIRRYTRETHPKEWEAFIEYAMSDITSMRELWLNHLPKWNNTATEEHILAVDQIINNRGFHVDTELAKAAIAAITKHKAELQAEAVKSFGGTLTGDDFLPTLRNLAPGWDIPNAQKGTMQGLLDDEELPDEARMLVELRLGASSTASTKYHPLLNGLSADGRRRGCLQYGGASRTNRWAGKGFQPQNLARGFFSDDPKNKKEKKREDWMSDEVWHRTLNPLSFGIEMLLKGRADRLFDVSQLTATTVRSCVIPEPGNRLAVADYSNVEGRGLAWVAGEETALEVFREGRDIYCESAGKMFGMDPAYIKKQRKDLRQIGKTCELGLGYNGGVGAFVSMARINGVDLEMIADMMEGTFPEHIWNAAKKGYEYARIQEKNKRGFKGQRPDRPSYDLPKKVWLTCDSIKRMWREAHPMTVKFWSDIERGAKAAINNPGRSFWAGAPVRENGDRAIRIFRTGTKKEPGWWLCIELPSGRCLSYPGIGISVERTAVDPDEAEGDKVYEYRDKITFMGQNQTTKQWSKQYTYGGKLTENIVQALCRDLLGNALITVEEAGWPIVLHVHDEIVTEMPDTDEFTADKLEELMCRLPKWAGGFPLEAEGDVLYRYAK